MLKDVAALLRCGEDAVHDEVVRQLRALVVHGASTGWAISVGPSSAPESGDGVRVEGSCAAGTVLTVYPGVSFRPEDLPMMHGIVLKGNSYVLARRDGVLLDARPDGPSAQIYEVASRRDAAAGRGCTQLASTLAVGHKINHPPAGTLPNVAVCPLDLTDAEADLLPNIRTFAFRPPAEGEPHKQTAVLVASRPLCDEELWLDYKLRPESRETWEPWYAPVVAGAAQRGTGSTEQGAATLGFLAAAAIRATDAAKT